jgi:hypothetical protein
MTRAWNTVAGYAIDILGVLWFTLIVLAVAGLIGAAWHFYPDWLPQRVWSPKRSGRKAKKGGAKKGRGRKRRDRRRGTKADAVPALIVADDALPDFSAAAFRARADAYAAEGRFAEAVRERLRAIVRDLVDARVIPQHPDWTVTELARAAASVRPALEPALTGASTIFSDIWYGQRPADAGHDARMRDHDTTVHQILTGVPV